MDASIIIPAYNSERTIAYAITALKKQDFGGTFEIIAVDDGSKDGTAQVAANAGAIVVRRKNAGPATARNLGAKKSRGKILLFTDSDCSPEKNWLTQMLAPFKNKEVVGVQGAYRTKQGSLVARFVQSEIEERYERMKSAKNLDWIGSYAAAYRRGDFFEAGGFDESFPKASGEDPELSYKLAKKGKKLVFNPNAIVYHTHPDTAGKYFWTKFYRAFYRVNLYQKHPDKMINDSYTTNSIKIQIFAGYIGTFTTVMIPVLYYLGQFYIASAILLINMIFGIAAVLTFLKSALFVAKSDWKIAIFSLFMIQVRTVAFMLGLPAGYIRQMVLR